MNKILILIMGIFLFTGCNNIKELNNIALIKQIAFIKEDNNYNIIYNIEETLNKEKVINTYSFIGNNLENTYNSINYSLDKKLYIAHLNTVIIDDGLLKSDYSNIIRILTKDKKNRLDFNLYATHNSLVDESMKYLKDKKSFNNLVNNSNNTTSTVSKIRFDKFLNYYYEEQDFVIPLITKDDYLQLNNYLYFKNNIIFSELTTKESIIYNYFNDLISQVEIFKVSVLRSKSIVKKNKKTLDIIISSKVEKTSQDNRNYYKHNLKKEIINFAKKYFKNIKKVNCKINLEDDNYEL